MTFDGKIDHVVGMRYTNIPTPKILCLREPTINTSNKNFWREERKTLNTNQFHRVKIS